MAEILLNLKNADANITHYLHAAQDLLVESGARVSPKQRANVYGYHNWVSAKFTIPKDVTLPDSFFHGIHDLLVHEEGVLSITHTKPVTESLMHPAIVNADLRRVVTSVRLGPQANDVLYTTSGTATPTLVREPLTDVLVEDAYLGYSAGQTHTGTYLASRYGVAADAFSVRTVLGVPSEEGRWTNTRLQNVHLDTLPADALSDLFLMKGSIVVRLDDGTRCFMNHKLDDGAQHNSFLLHATKDHLR